jgi:TetR/AcrR family transcriptional repressor of nem operon
MAGRPRLYEDDQIIDKAIEIFRSKCYDAASTGELLAAMGIGKGSFYLNFKGGKEELYQRTLRRFAEILNRKVEIEVEQSASPLNYIKGLFLQMADLPANRKDKGCYFGNALIQLSKSENHTKFLAADLLEDLRKIFTKAIRNTQEKGQLSKQKDAERLGWYLINFWNGFHITKRVEKSPKILRELIEDNFRLLK